MLGNVFAVSGIVGGGGVEGRWLRVWFLVWFCVGGGGEMVEGVVLVCGSVWVVYEWRGDG